MSVNYSSFTPTYIFLGMFTFNIVKDIQNNLSFYASKHLYLRFTNPTLSISRNTQAYSVSLR